MIFNDCLLEHVTPLPLTAAVGDDEIRIPADQAATPGQAQAMLKGNVREREQEHVELMELERYVVYAPIACLI